MTTAGNGEDGSQGTLPDEIVTPRLRLRRFRVDDADLDRLVALHNDPEVMRYLTGGAPMSRDQVAADLREAFAGPAYRAAERRDTGAFAGWFVLRPDADRAPGDRELGYRLRREAWGQGLATEGARALVAAAFADPAVERVWAQTMAVNAGSRRVMEKAGLRFVRVFHVHFDEPLPGTEHGEVEYAITRAEWQAATS